ncbi:MAG: hypothetical protein IJG50_02495 [Clostridia bacterium]|nr:hypothetical protein [Clostridia bacterium]
MSVEKMQLVHVLGSMDMFPRAADILCDTRNFHPENTKEFLGKFENIVPFESRNPYDHTLSLALESLSLASLKPQKKDFSAVSKSDREIELYFEDVRDYYLELGKKKDDYASAISKSEYAIGFLEPLGSLDVPVSKLVSFEYIAVRFGKMPVSSNEKYKLFIMENEDVFFFPFKEDKESVYGMYIAPTASIEKADAVFDSLGFERLPSGEEYDAAPKETIEMLGRDIEKMKESITALENEGREYAEKNGETMLTLYAKTRHDFEVYKLMCHAAHSESTFYLVGWVPKRNADALKASFESEEALMCNFVTDRDEEIECPDIMPPTKLRNFALFRPFEAFLKMYALPSYNEMDPTPLLAIAYSILFGVMFGDVGQGAVLFIAGLIFGFVKKRTLGKIIACVGVFSIIFGFVYGSFFGYEDIIHGPFHAMEHISFTLTGSVILGMVMVVFMIILNIINGFRQKNFEKVVFSSNGFAGLALYVGIIAVILLLFNLGANLLSPWFIVVFIVIPLILIWFREPLSHLCLRRKWKPEDKAMYFVENFFELIDVLLSALTNTLSFIRVGAFALNHVGMMMVVFILAEQANGGQNMAVVVIGNIFVMALEGLLVGIQVLRLNYYEFFSRFYEGNGRAFEPVSIKYNKNNI